MTMIIVTQIPTLSECEYRYFSISSIKQESCDTYVLRFQLPDGKCLGLHTGQHIIMRVIGDGRVITRQYTPVSPLHALGYFDLLIKIYPDGRMSRHVKALKTGDKVELRGPCGRFSYSPNKWQRLVLLAAGTGIAPMIQVIRQVIINERDDTRLLLVYTCKRYEDLLLKSQLEECSAYWNVTILYILTQDSPERVRSLKRYGDNIHHGRLDYHLLSQVLGNISPDNYVLICGTTSFEKDMISYLVDSGISSHNYHKF
ncbi:NADH-cytochrome b5 reductase-like isoform X2 [Liolophura sinensis]|uniref:NADH-cytochrome b5 reductase-like isoform X2 n=1 Tax=Liolophura sinensis TaxID=3198878 RepID=UPI003159798C